MFVKKPPMGFNTWNTFGEKINEDLIMETADAMVHEGLLDAGYEYLVIDDCWSEYDRDPKTHQLVPHHEKFPHGIKYVADYVHAKGLKFGIYSCAGVRTCADYPGSYDHEYLDAKTFASWGVDYLKYDYCNKPGQTDGPFLYRRMGMALRNCGRDILFSACNWGIDDVWSWARSVGADIYRSPAMCAIILILFSTLQNHSITVSAATLPAVSMTWTCSQSACTGKAMSDLPAVMIRNTARSSLFGVCTVHR